MTIVEAAGGVTLIASALAGFAWMWHRGRAQIAVFAATCLLSAAWWATSALVSIDYRDADGWVDCWPNCSLWQTSVRWTLVTGPLGATLLAAGALIAPALRRPTRSS